MFPGLTRSVTLPPGVKSGEFVGPKSFLSVIPSSQRFTSTISRGWVLAIINLCDQCSTKRSFDNNPGNNVLRARSFVHELPLLTQSLLKVAIHRTSGWLKKRDIASFWARSTPHLPAIHVEEQRLERPNNFKLHSRPSMAETQSALAQEGSQPRKIPERATPLQIRPPSAVALPPHSSASRIRNSYLNLDAFSPVNQNGSFEFDRVLKSGFVQKRTRRTKVGSH